MTPSSPTTSSFDEDLARHMFDEGAANVGAADEPHHVPDPETLRIQAAKWSDEVLVWYLGELKQLMKQVMTSLGTENVESPTLLVSSPRHKWNLCFSLS
ncbi:hypothetical protein GE061_014378 [Apolygus lucorum]|uniref:Uncharacterized protein n=1 Tax=Apolygus lucorum TaxID=248454 RepID=A0A8S9XSH0_APOLU|nr:hypothetical protein GE061_018311 [Apolygus lucorum]KAF6211261.1 hypothetical protein GE061_014378 [Apolygus lucorum]